MRLIAAILFSVPLMGFLAPSLSAEEPEAGRMEDVAFTAELDGTEQRYVLIHPPASKEGQKYRDALIALHGHGSDRWQFAKDPRGECSGSRDVAAKHGMLFVSPDYRARTSWMGPAAEADVVQIIADLKEQHGVERVFICGGSMGGTSALTFAELHPDLVVGVASMNGAANVFELRDPNMEAAMHESYGGSKAEKVEEYKRRSAEYWPERLTMPISVTLGGRDTVVPPDSVRRLTGILKQLGREVLVIDRPEGGHDTNYEDTNRMLEFVIEKAK